jgi:hypothetical protein
MALGSYETALGWLGSENRKSSIRVFLDYMQLCTSKLDMAPAELVNSFAKVQTLSSLTSSIVYPLMHTTISLLSISAAATSYSSAGSHSSMRNPLELAA